MFQIQRADFHVLPMRTRFPFKYGIASMSALPHLFVSVGMRVDGRQVTGLSSEGLPPKWFTKDPSTTFEHDLAEMLSVIQNAARVAGNAAEKPVRFFPWWKETCEEQKRWAGLRRLPALLSNLGVSLIERAVLDGLCKSGAVPLHVFLKSDEAGIDLGGVRPELHGMRVAGCLPESPLSNVAARHTVGLGDPLRTSEIPGDERLDDGLPQALDECIRSYGLRWFKIKICGREETDIPRLREITRVLAEGCPRGFQATLDGNEQFQSLADFREFYRLLHADKALAPLFDSLVFIEQPLHRDHALRDDVASVLEAWKDGPGIIIDEADGSLDDLPRALDLGYSGTSHKNCKGIVKGLANSALLQKRAAFMTRAPILSAEDLANVGPVALLQDLAMVAALGIPHVERNGHHYFRGLGMHSPGVQEEVLRAHAGLYRRHERGFAALGTLGGLLDLASVNSAPFGCAIQLDPARFTPLDAWVKGGGLAELG